MKKLPLLIALLLGATLFAASLIVPREEARRLEVLFLGHPTPVHPGHDPVTRYRILKKHLGDQGINLTYVEDPAVAFHSDTLAQFDALLVYANWQQHGDMPAEQEQALVNFVENGGGFLPIHCASACYGKSEAFVGLVGGVFKSHTSGVFSPKTIDRNHPITKDLEPFEAWDETYVHERLSDDRTVLQKRGDEPWTWIRTQGKGRVFYTASGHDHRVWDLPAFGDLIRRGIYWSVGDDKRAKIYALGLPEFEMMNVELPGYREKKLVTSVPKPFSPEESFKLAQVPPGFELSLFAAEPDIINPISINWDAQGRAYVIETIDYPNNHRMGVDGNDRIKICEDTDGDGAADKFTVFADKLSIPTSLVFSNGGVIVTNCTEILFLKDTNGDDKADVREVLFSGFNNNDTHAGVSNLRWGFDNWIYATIGYAGFNGSVGGEDHRFSSGVFRFKPDGSKLEFLQNTTNNTWGLGFTEEFDVIGSTANANPSWFMTFPRSYYDKANLPQPRTPRADDNPLFNPSSFDIRQVDAFDRYTAGAGHAVYTARRFPERYWNKVAFVCAPTGKLVGEFEMSREGAGFKNHQAYNNLYNSADAWSGPVAAEVGPDGAVWICDWYNIVIQHNPTPNKGNSGLAAKNGRGNAYVTPHRDKQHGRIYRIYPQGTPNDPAPEDLRSGLNHPNLFWRQTTQRLAIESGDRTPVEHLREMMSEASADNLAAVHAFGILKGIGALDLEIIKTALASPNIALRRAGLRNAPLDNTLESMFISKGSIKEEDPRTLLELLLALSRLAPSNTIGTAVYNLTEAKPDILEDETLRDAIQVAARRHASGFLKSAVVNMTAPDQPAKAINILPNPDFSQVENGKPAHWSNLRVYGGNSDGITLASSPDGRNGTPCLMIRSEQRRDCGAALTLPIQPNTRYRLSGWVRTENLKTGNSPGAMMNLHSGQRTKGIKGTTDWTELSVEFNSGSDREALIHCLFGGYGGASGTAWWDDISLVALSSGDPATNLPREIAIHFGKTASPAAKDALVDSLRASNNPAAISLAETISSQSSETGTVVRKYTPDPAVHQRGAEIYNLTCIACHGPEGIGVPGAFPPLDDSSWVTGDPEIPIKILLHGLMGPIEVKGATYTNVMPSHATFTDQQISDVLTYVRQNWSNDASPVTTEQAGKTRAATKDRKAPWTTSELLH